MPVPGGAAYCSVPQLLLILLACTLQVDQWLDFACTALVSGSGFEAACKAVNDFVSMRTLLVGYAVSMADVACWGQLQGVFIS